MLDYLRLLGNPLVEQVIAAEEHVIRADLADLDVDPDKAALIARAQSLGVVRYTLGVMQKALTEEELHEWIEGEIKSNPFLTVQNGIKIRREFHGIWRDENNPIMKEFYAKCHALYKKLNQYNEDHKEAVLKWAAKRNEANPGPNLGLLK